MKIGLIDIDSKIPNLALMKLSAYHKSWGEKVELTSELFANQFDVICASKIFDYTVMPELPKDSILGGTGIDLDMKLASIIEEIRPDYSLYNCNYAMGFTSRGCNRKCPFCIVPAKEGSFKIVCEDIKEFWDGQDRIMLLDNSMNTDEKHFLNILQQLIDNKIKTDFSQGLDIRYLTDKQAHFLTKVRLWKQIHFAWDEIFHEDFVRNGIKILGTHLLKSKSMFYVLIGWNTTPEEDLYRVETMEGLGVDPFVMPYNKFDSYQKNFAKWVNHKAIFKSVKWKDYSK